MAAVFVLTPIQLHRMGNERYGILVIATSIAGYLMFLELGVGWALTKYLASTMESDEPQTKRYIGAAFAVALPVASVAAIVLAAFAGPLARVAFSVPGPSQADAIFAFRALALFVPLALIFNIVSAVARALERFFLQAVVGAFVPVGINVTWVVVAGRPHDIAVVMLAQISAIGLATLAMGITLLRSQGDSIWPSRPARGDVSALLRFGGWSTLNRLGFVGLTTLDTIFVGVVLPLAAVPSYSLPFSIASRIALFCSTAVAVLMPTLSRRHASNPSSASSAAGRAEPLVVGLTVATVATLAFSGKSFLAAYVDHAFAAGGAAIALTYLAIAFGAYGISSLDGVLLEAAGQPRRPAVAMVVGAIVGLPMLVLLARAFGVAGAACGVACGSVTTGLLQLRAGCQLRGEGYGHRAVRLVRIAAPPVVGAVVGSGLARIAGVNGYVSIAITGVAAFGALLPTLQSAKEEQPVGR
jgi:O-antigen/teichoic acid export membrane protein